MEGAGLTKLGCGCCCGGGIASDGLLGIAERCEKPARKPCEPTPWPPPPTRAWASVAIRPPASTAAASTLVLRIICLFLLGSWFVSVPAYDTWCFVSDSLSRSCCYRSVL